MFNLAVIILTSFLYILLFYLFFKLIVWIIAHIVCAVKEKTTDIENKKKGIEDKDK